MIDTTTIHRYEKGSFREMEETLVRELRANLIINGRYYISMMCMPKNLEQLAIGFLFSEGIISSYEDIEQIMATRNGNIYVSMNKPVDFNQNKKRVLTSGCAKGSVNLSFLKDKNLKQLEGKASLSPQTILGMMMMFGRHSDVFKDTGAVHSAALLFPNGERIFFDDIGRHNAVDKIIGSCLIKKLPIDKGVLLISGRISSEIALKTAKLGISILISQSAPTNMSVAISRKLNMTLVGFVRGFRFNVYSGAHRIVGSQNSVFPQLTATKQ